MQFFESKDANLYLKETGVENLFISEYMAGLPGECIKVYLLAKMYAELNETPTEQDFAKQLGLSQESVSEAFACLQKAGLVGVERTGGMQLIEILSLRDKLYKGRLAGLIKEEPDGEALSSDLTDEELSKVFTAVEQILGRMLNPTEARMIDSWISDLGATPEMVLYAYNYCVNQMNKSSVNYVKAVVTDWVERGLRTDESIDEYIKNNDARHALYYKILKTLGMGGRNPSEPEKKLIDRWLDQDGYKPEQIMFACDHSLGANKPTLKYIDGVLKKMTESGQIKVGKGLPADHLVSIAKVKQYYEYLSQERKQLAEKHLEEVYARIPEVKELDQSIRQARMSIIGMGYKNPANKENLSKLRETRAELLQKGGFPPDYTEDKYYCQICKDTGFLDDGSKCSCYEQRANEAKEWQNSLTK